MVRPDGLLPDGVRAEWFWLERIRPEGVRPEGLGPERVRLGRFGLGDPLRCRRFRRGSLHRGRLHRGRLRLRVRRRRGLGRGGLPGASGVERRLQIGRGERVDRGVGVVVLAGRALVVRAGESAVGGENRAAHHGVGPGQGVRVDLSVRVGRVLHRGRRGVRAAVQAGDDGRVQENLAGQPPVDRQAPRRVRPGGGELTEGGAPVQAGVAVAGAGEGGGRREHRDVGVAADDDGGQLGAVGVLHGGRGRGEHQVGVGQQPEVRAAVAVRLGLGQPEFEQVGAGGRGRGDLVRRHGGLARWRAGGQGAASRGRAARHGGDRAGRLPGRGAALVHPRRVGDLDAEVGQFDEAGAVPVERLVHQVGRPPDALDVAERGHHDVGQAGEVGLGHRLHAARGAELGELGPPVAGRGIGGRAPARLAHDLFVGESEEQGTFEEVVADGLGVEPVGLAHCLDVVAALLALAHDEDGVPFEPGQLTSQPPGELGPLQQDHSLRPGAGPRAPARPCPEPDDCRRGRRAQTRCSLGRRFVT